MREGRNGTKTDAELLTDREWDCLCYVVERYSSKQIALRLGVAPKTVDSYLDAARVKLGARTRQEAAQILVSRYGAISPRKGLPGESPPGDDFTELAPDDLVLIEGASVGRHIGGEPERADRTGDLQDGARQSLPRAVPSDRDVGGGLSTSDQLGTARTADAQSGGSGFPTRLLGASGSQGFGSDQPAGVVLPRASDPGVESDRRHAAFASDGGRHGLGPLGTLAAIGLFAVLFALAAGGTLAGLSALENLLDRRGPPAHAHPPPLFHGQPA